jgi:hypothetical protein
VTGAAGRLLLGAPPGRQGADGAAAQLEAPPRPPALEGGAPKAALTAPPEVGPDDMRTL